MQRPWQSSWECQPRRSWACPATNLDGDSGVLPERAITFSDCTGRPASPSVTWSRGVTPKVKMATFRNYRESAESFAKDYGEYVRGLTDSADFANAVKDSGKFGVGTEGYHVRVAEAIRAVAKRMDCE